MKLIEPSLAYERQLRAYRSEFLQPGMSMDGGGSLIRFEEPRDWLAYVERCKNPATVPPGLVPALQWIYVREADEKVVGVIQLRPTMSEALRYSGQIGYSVAPSERRRGYATRMLRELLPLCRELGLRRVMVCCHPTNEASRRTILRCGGVYESTVRDPVRDRELERYWIELEGRADDAAGGI